MKFYFPFPFSDKIFCDIQHVMNRRNIIVGSRTVRLIRTPAALIYHAVLCCIFAVSLSIIHETQIPFTFFRDFLKKVFGALSVSQSSTASGLNLSVTGFAVTAPLVGEPLAGRRVFGVWRFAPFGSAGVMFTSAAEVALGADRRKDRKMNLMPRPPLLGEVASSVSDDDGEVQPPAAAPGGKPLSHGLRRDSSPNRGALGRPSRFRGLALRSFWQCWRNVRLCGRSRSWSR